MIIVCPFTQVSVRILETNWVKGMGIISYGIYLYHYPILVFLELQMRKKGLDVSNYWISYGLTGLALTIMVAGLSYLVIEKPCLKLARGV